MLNCPDCGERLVRKRAGRCGSRLECNSCKKEFDDQGNELDHDEDLIELYQEIGGEG